MRSIASFLKRVATSLLVPSTEPAQAYHSKCDPIESRWLRTKLDSVAPSHCLQDPLRHIWQTFSGCQNVYYGNQPLKTGFWCRQNRLCALKWMTGRDWPVQLFWYPHWRMQASQDKVETESRAHWRPLCPEAPEVAGLTDQSSEGTEERQAPYDEVYTVLPQRGLPSEALCVIDLFAEAFLERMAVLRSAFSLDGFR